MSVILIVALCAAGLCLLDDDHGAGIELCLLILVVIPLAVWSIDLALVGRVEPPVRRRPWLLLHPSPPSPI